MQPTALDEFGLSPVFVHAHPDDESISTGGTIAALVQQSAAVTVVTGTRGERGEVVPGELQHLEGTAALGPHRLRELAEAMAALAPVTHHLLGPRVYADSGMQWGAGGFAEAAADAPADALSLAPLDEVVAAVLDLLPQGATSIVSYDAQGGYGHPDHVRMHEAGLEAARVRGIPFFAIVEPRVDATEAGSTAGEAAGSVAAGAPAELTVTLSDSALAAKLAAMGAHATQLTLHTGAEGTPAFTLSGGQTHPVPVVERFRRLR